MFSAGIRAVVCDVGYSGRPRACVRRLMVCRFRKRSWVRASSRGNSVPVMQYDVDTMIWNNDRNPVDESLKEMAYDDSK